MGKIDKAFAITKKSLGAITADSSGYFYFVSDKKGKHVLLIVTLKGKSKTVSLGRGALQEFKDTYSASTDTKFCQGQVLLSGSTLIFEIEKGSAKPGMMKLGLKKSTSLHTGIGAKKSALMSAKIRMAGQSPPEERDAGEEAERDQALETWRRNPANAKLIMEIGDMSQADIVELFEAEVAFKAHRDSLPSPRSETVALEELAARNEEALAALDTGKSALLEALESGDIERALEMERDLDEQRAALAADNASGPDFFASDSLSPIDQEALKLSLNTGIRLLIDRMVSLKREIQVVREALEAAEDEAEQQAGQARMQTLEETLASLKRQFDAQRHLRV